MFTEDFSKKYYDDIELFQFMTYFHNNTSTTQQVAFFVR